VTDPMVESGLSAEALDVPALTGRIRRPDCGALVTFEGTTRSPSDGRVVKLLEYEAYEGRATAQLRALAVEATQKWDLGGVVAMHRTGAVPIGEPSVLVACSAPHRGKAFEAARWLIDTIKADVAIWKKEIFEDGEAWVGTDV
jgi:molybdopterin synthase catalytic subunit